MNQERIGEIIAKRRKTKNLTQEELAEKLDVRVGDILAGEIVILHHLIMLILQIVTLTLMVINYM